MAPSVHFEDLPGSLPPDGVPQDTNLLEVQQVAQRALESFSQEAFTDDLLWRDWLSLTGQIRTLHRLQHVVDTWKRLAAFRHPTDFQTQPARIVRPLPSTSWVHVNFTFTTRQNDGLVGHCSGHASLVLDDSHRWKIWMLVTMLDYFDGLGDPEVPRKAMNGIANGTNHSSLENDYDVVILGAGQNGLSLAGRLDALGIKYVLLEREPAIGINWIGRYESVRQHTIREYNNLPFDRTWKPDDPELLPGSAVAEGFRNYVDKYNISLSLSTETSSCTWNSRSQKWTLEVSIEGGEKRTLSSRHLALSIGAGMSVDVDPKIPGVNQYQGILLSSGAYKHSRAWKGKSGIVIGSGTMAHDIAQDMLDAGLSSITMVQRNKTAIYPIEWVIKGQSGPYNLRIPTHIADAEGGTRPNKISRDIIKRLYDASFAAEAARFDALERAGFRVDRATPLMDNIYARYGGYYIDIGTSPHIASGAIQVKSGVPIEKFVGNGVRFEDGSEVEGEVVVVAVGQDHDYRNQVAGIVGWDVARGLGEFWGLDEEGEVRGVMRPAAPGLWLVGGTAPQARHWSKFIALQMQADLLGKPLWKTSGKGIGDDEN